MVEILIHLSTLITTAMTYLQSMKYNETVSNYTSLRREIITSKHITVVNIVKLKVKLSHYHHAGDKRERKYSSYSFLTLALDGGEWSVTRTNRALPPREGPLVPIG
jgi:hypothetical protein